MDSVLPPAGQPHLLQIPLTTEGVTKTLHQWAVHSALHFYPDIGTRTYRVPALCFNHQALATPEQAVRKGVVSLPSSLTSSSSPFLVPSSSSSDASSSSSSTASSSSRSSLSLESMSRMDGYDDSAETGHHCASASSNVALCDSEVLVKASFPCEVSSVDGQLICEVEQGGCSRYGSAVTSTSCVLSSSNAGTPAGKADCAFPSSQGRDEQKNVEAPGGRTHGPSSGCREGQTTEPRTAGGRDKQGRPGLRGPQGKKPKRHTRDETTNPEHPLTISTILLPSSDSGSEEDRHVQEKDVSASDVPHTKDDQGMNTTTTEKNQDRDLITTCGTVPPKQAAPQATPSHKTHRTKEPQPPVLVLCPPQESMVRRDKAMNIVLDSFEKLGKELEEGPGQEGVFLISGVNYDHYLSRIPGQVMKGCDGGGYLGASPTCRGILDLLVLHRGAGVMVVQVKSVGGNVGEWLATEEQVVQALHTVVHKVRSRSATLREDVSRELTPHLSHADRKSVTCHVLALPFVPRRLYTKALEGDTGSRDTAHLTDLKVLCMEDFENAPLTRTAMKRRRPGGGREERKDACVGGDGGWTTKDRSPLWRWWTRLFGQPWTRLSLDNIRSIVGRVCGVFSTLCVVPDARCRSQVRTLGHCVSETAVRHSAPCLTPSQYDVLHCRQPYVSLAGPPGSGKSLLLTLNAVQWLEQSARGVDHVVVASLTRAPHTQPRDRALLRAIQRRKPKGGAHGVLHRVLFHLNQVLAEDVEREVLASITRLQRRARQASALDTVVGSEERGNYAKTWDTEDQVIGGSREDEGTEGLNTPGQVSRLHFVLNDVDPRDRKTQRVLLALASAPQVHSVWWTTTEPPGTQDAWSNQYAVRKMRHVTRRPPCVQRVLQKLEWREEWAGMYATDSVQAGLPTQGPPVLCVQHQHHRQASTRGTVRARAADLCRDSCNNNIKPPAPEQDHTNNNLSCVESPVHAERKDAEQDFRKSNATVDCATCQDSSDFICLSEQDTSGRQDNLEQLPSSGADFESFPPLVCEPVCAACEKRTVHSNSSVHSPFWCEMCADTVVSIIAFLTTDSINPTVAPFVAGPTKLLKDPSKNKFGEAIKPQDVLILTTVPPVRDRSPAAEADDTRRLLEDLAHCPLVTRVQARVPVKVVTSESEGRLAFPRHFAVLTDTSSCRGLERKVVIYVPWTSETSHAAGHASEHTGEHTLQSACDREPHSMRTGATQNHHRISDKVREEAFVRADTANLPSLQRSTHETTNHQSVSLPGEMTAPLCSTPIHDGRTELPSVCCGKETSCGACEEAAGMATTRSAVPRHTEDKNSNSLTPVDEAADRRVLCTLCKVCSTDMPSAKDTQPGNQPEESDEDSSTMVHHEGFHSRRIGTVEDLRQPGPKSALQQENCQDAPTTRTLRAQSLNKVNCEGEQTRQAGDETSARYLPQKHQEQQQQLREDDENSQQHQQHHLDHQQQRQTARSDTTSDDEGPLPGWIEDKRKLTSLFVPSYTHVLDLMERHKASWRVTDTGTDMLGKSSKHIHTEHVNDTNMRDVYNEAAAKPRDFLGGCEQHEVPAGIRADITGTDGDGMEELGGHREAGNLEEEQRPNGRFISNHNDIHDTTESPKVPAVHHGQTARAARETGDGGTRHCEKEDLDDLLEGLSDVNRHGVYSAASCCLAQLVLVFP